MMHRRVSHQVTSANEGRLGRTAQVGVGANTPTSGLDSRHNDHATSQRSSYQHPRHQRHAYQRDQQHQQQHDERNAHSAQPRTTAWHALHPPCHGRTRRVHRNRKDLRSAPTRVWNQVTSIASHLLQEAAGIWLDAIDWCDSSPSSVAAAAAAAVGTTGTTIASTQAAPLGTKSDRSQRREQRRRRRLARATKNDLYGDDSERRDALAILILLMILGWVVWYCAGLLHVWFNPNHPVPAGERSSWFSLSGLVMLSNAFSSSSPDYGINFAKQGRPETKQAHRKRLYSRNPSPYYAIPTSMTHIGDKSDYYAKLRRDADDELSRLIEEHQVSAPSAGSTRLSRTDAMVAMLAEASVEGLKRAPLRTKLMASIEQEAEEDKRGAASTSFMEAHSRQTIHYDINNCPDIPPEGYPYEWNLVDDVLKAWPLDDANLEDHQTIHQGVCIFDYRTDFDKAMTYREAEVPYILRNDPRVLETVLRWNLIPDYMQRMLGGPDGSSQYRTEYSENNHFLYWNPETHPSKRTIERKRKQNSHFKLVEKPANWTKPTKIIHMTYSNWLSKANSTEVRAPSFANDVPHWYFRLIGCGETGAKGQCDPGYSTSEYLFDELPFFQPRYQEQPAPDEPAPLDPRPSTYLVDPNAQRGIHCRFGMKGVVAENHFDASRNSIVVLGGARRYILNQPNQCPHLCLYPVGHPSARHSSVDWSPSSQNKECPEFHLATANEVVLQAGDVLYLPTEWFHTIVSLSMNYQCNTRSGVSHQYTPFIEDCGF